jgi:uncharacterized protein YjiS (DUF1127 family)
MATLPALASVLRLPRRALHEGLGQIGRNLASRLVAIRAVLSRMWEHGRQRRDLQGLDERMLRDIGLTREDTERESRLPVWRLWP